MKEVKMEDFIDKDELDNMTQREREIYEYTFSINKQNIQALTDALEIMNNLNNSF